MQFSSLSAELHHLPKEMQPESSNRIMLKEVNLSRERRVSWLQALLPSLNSMKG